jgi:hypothetical protein
LATAKALPETFSVLAKSYKTSRDVIAWVRGNQSFDNEKIVAWGSSLGAKHPTALIVEDHGLAAGMVLRPAVDGFLSALHVPLWRHYR